MKKRAKKITPKDKKINAVIKEGRDNSKSDFFAVLKRMVGNPKTVK